MHVIITIVTIKIIIILIIDCKFLMKEWYVDLGYNFLKTCLDFIDWINLSWPRATLISTIPELRAFGSLKMMFEGPELGYGSLYNELGGVIFPRKLSSILRNKECS